MGGDWRSGAPPPSGRKGLQELAAATAILRYPGESSRCSDCGASSSPEAYSDTSDLSPFLGKHVWSVPNGKLKVIELRDTYQSNVALRHVALTYSLVMRRDRTGWRGRVAK